MNMLGCWDTKTVNWRQESCWATDGPITAYGEAERTWFVEPRILFFLVEMLASSLWWQLRKRPHIFDSGRGTSRGSRLTLETTRQLQRRPTRRGKQKKVSVIATLFARAASTFAAQSCSCSHQINTSTRRCLAAPQR